MSNIAILLCGGFLGFLLALNLVGHGWIVLLPRS